MNPISVAAVEKLIVANRRVNVSEIVKELQIAAGSVENIIHKQLHMSKVCSRWVPRKLRQHDRHQRVASCQELLDLYTSDKEKFHPCLVTGDETWIHHWDPDSKLESMQWQHVEFPPPKKFRIQPSADNIMAAIFWDSEELLLVDYLPPKKTIASQYYANLCLNCVTPSNRNVVGSCHWVFDFVTTIRQFTSHLLHSMLFVTVDLFN